MGGGGCGGWRGAGGVNVTFFSSVCVCGVGVGVGGSQDTVGRIGFFGCAHKRPSVFSVTGQFLHFYCD